MTATGHLRRIAAASGLLLAVFAISMAISFDIKSPLDASVFSASAEALLLALDRDVRAARRREDPARKLETDSAR